MVIVHVILSLYFYKYCVNEFRGGFCLILGCFWQLKNVIFLAGFLQ